jgi:hypothetical protein
MEAIKLIEPCGVAGVMYDAGTILVVPDAVSKADAEDLKLMQKAIETAKPVASKPSKGKAAE